MSLYNLLGWSAFVGVAIMIFSVPLNTCKIWPLNFVRYSEFYYSYCEGPEEDARATNEKQRQTYTFDE